MKKWSRRSKKTMKRSSRSKKLTRRRRQRGGGTVMINCTVNPSTGAVTAKSSDPSVTVSVPTGTMKTLMISSTIPIKNIKFANAPPGKVGAPGITLQDMADGKFVIPSTSFIYAKGAAGLTKEQKRMDAMVGMAFPSAASGAQSGLKISNLELNNLGVIGSGVVPFVITITT